MTDELGSRLERPIHFECKLNKPMHIGMRLLHTPAADHSVSISRQQLHHIYGCVFLKAMLHLTNLTLCLYKDKLGLASDNMSPLRFWMWPFPGDG